MAKTALPETIPLYTPNQQALECLSDTLSRKPWLPLGIYYEYLWHFLLSRHPGPDLLAHNLQVSRINNGVKKTLGEYDLIYRCNGKLYHRELAVKFYLGVPLTSASESPWQHWVGPGLKDRLDRKMHRLLEHQIRLSDTPEGGQALSQFGSDRVQKEVLIQGCLFYPMFAHCPAPVDINPDHRRGYWLTINDYRQWLSKQRPAPRSKILNKPFWLDNEGPEDHLPPTEHLKALSRNRLPQMVKHNRQYLFVVPNDWPERAILCAKG